MLSLTDNNWNLVQDEKQKYFYDYKNRLIKVTNIENEVIAEYSYDVLGRRSSHKLQDWEKIIKYVYAGNNAIIEKIYENNELSETKENIYSNNLDDILATIITKDWKRETYYYTKNQLWSITSITDKSWKVIEEYKYNVFWKAFIRSGKSNNWKEFKESKIWNTRLFTWREYDAELKLYYNRARYYSPDLGRFISRDPIDIADDINLYAYVGNNSVNFVDLMGLEKQLLRDINNGNTFLVELVARNLNDTFWFVWIHTFIMIHSYWDDGSYKEYTIWWHNNQTTWMLDWEFNSKKDFISSNWYFWKWAFKWSIFFETPEWMSDSQFVRNIYDEYLKYEDNQKNYEKYSADNSYDNKWNCNNFSTTLLYNASNRDSLIVSSISNFNPGWFNPWLGEPFSWWSYRIQQEAYICSQ